NRVSKLPPSDPYTTACLHVLQHTDCGRNDDRKTANSGSIEDARQAARRLTRTLSARELRKEYAAAVREAFADRLARACPEFIPVKKHSALTGFAGERAFCSRVSEALRHWVVLVPDQKREAFFVELGWSRKRRFPQLAMRPSGTPPEEAGSEEEYLCRLGELARGSDFGWLVEALPMDASQDEMLAYIVAQTKPIAADVARARVVPHVEEALREFVQYGLPFLRKHA
ncbi:MAG: hypothetical protein R3357_09530, partial [Burkholderiales bacterium]|nr:hypothetical protein [Burkholderiales bacterium]